MIEIKKFVFNPFQENTYILYNESKDCIIIDPGCYSSDEENELKDFICIQQLKPVRLINTHGHFDHILGNRFIFETYGIEAEIHINDVMLINTAEEHAKMFGFKIKPVLNISKYLTEKDSLTLGGDVIEILETPGHSPGGICLVCKKEKFVIAGDVLFQNSIGRTDLPGGSYDQLANSIKNKLFNLEHHFVVYSGHGDETSIGHEKLNNPFII